MSHKFPYKWYLKNGYPAQGIEKNNLNVFGTFICGGGSSMGYKLAGFNHLGGVEIDKKVAEVYKENHSPKHLFNMDIRDFNTLENLPQELYYLDILDGSPPCSTFSMAGSREKAWGKEKQFREGQSLQTLDDLVFVYCETIKKLKPKVFILENVKGIIQGNAKAYSKKIVETMRNAGYTVQVFCLNAASMGVPQKRERVFFIGFRNELDFPKLVLSFNEKLVPYKDIRENNTSKEIENKDTVKAKLWHKVGQGNSFSKAREDGSFFGNKKLHPNEVASTIVADTHNGDWDYESPIMLSDIEIMQAGTYPLDYNFKDLQPKYLIGMSVPPVAVAQISLKIKEQWFDLLK